MGWKKQAEADWAVREALMRKCCPGTDQAAFDLERLQFMDAARQEWVQHRWTRISGWAAVISVPLSVLALLQGYFNP